MRDRRDGLQAFLQVAEAEDAHPVQAGLADREVLAVRGDREVRHGSPVSADRRAPVRREHAALVALEVQDAHRLNARVGDQEVLAVDVQGQRVDHLGRAETPATDRAHVRVFGVEDLDRRARRVEHVQVVLVVERDVDRATQESFSDRAPIAGALAQNALQAGVGDRQASRSDADAGGVAHGFGGAFRPGHEDGGDADVGVDGDDLGVTLVGDVQPTADRDARRPEPGRVRLQARGDVSVGSEAHDLVRVPVDDPERSVGPVGEVRGSVQVLVRAFEDTQGVGRVELRLDALRSKRGRRGRGGPTQECAEGCTEGQHKVDGGGVHHRSAGGSTRWTLDVTDPGPGIVRSWARSNSVPTERCSSPAIGSLRPGTLSA